MSFLCVKELRMAKLFYYIGQIEEQTGEHNFNSTIVWSAPEPSQSNLFDNHKAERDRDAKAFMDHQCKFWYGGEEDDEGEELPHEYNKESNWYTKDYDEVIWRSGGFKEISKKTFKEVQPFVTDMTGSYRWYNGMD